MAYHLVHRFGPKDKPQFRKEPFSTEPEAVIRACALLAARLEPMPRQLFIGQWRKRLFRRISVSAPEKNRCAV
jgi:hypothetical protein